MAVPYVLFSPIGSKDPTALDNKQNSLWDGSMLHICRKYRPEHIVLYFSKEMLAREQACRDCIVRLYTDLGLEVNDELIEAVKRPELVEVQKFDQYYEEFPKLLDELHKKFPQHTMLLNVSSGTPAMKNALHQIAYLSYFKVVPVQVKTPNKSLNRTQDMPYEDTTDREFNADNDPELYEDRCEEAEHRNYNFMIRCKDIKILLERYDYEAACQVAEEIKELLSPRALELLTAARERIRLNWRSIKKELKDELGIRSDDMKIGGRVDLSEYFLWLQVKQERGDLTDFLRGLSPILFQLMKIAVEEKMGLVLDKYCKGSTDNRMLELSLLAKDEQGKELQDILGIQGSKVSLSSNHYAKILERKGAEQPWKRPLLILRNIEMAVRNKAAHQITAGHEESILKAQKEAMRDPDFRYRLNHLENPLSSAEILGLVGKTVSALNEKAEKKDRLEINRSAYKDMNAKIAAALGESNK